MPERSIKQLDLSDDKVASRAHLIQTVAYKIEADLIGFDGIPQLHESVADMRAADETFVGYYMDGVLAGFVSYKIDGTTLDIHRLAVHPNYFRQRVATDLAQHVEGVQDGLERIIVATGAKNQPARLFYQDLGYILKDKRALAEAPDVEMTHFEKTL